MKINYSIVGLTLWAISGALSLTAGPITLVELGTAAPPGTIGGYSISALAADPSPIGTAVATLGSGAQTVGLDNPVTHLAIGSGWASWSHGHTGSVYWFDQLLFGDTLTLTLPSDTRAFQFYLQPNFFGSQTLTIAASNGGALQSFGSFALNGNGGAGGFGFYAAPGDSALSTITITGLGTFPDGFALGELGVNLGGVQSVPDDGAANWILGCALLALVAVRRFVR